MYTMSVDNYREGVDFVSKNIRGTPDVVVILGSGLAQFGAQLEEKSIIDIHTIPGLPAPTVEGHPGRIVCGRIGSGTVLVFQGRTHYYEFGNYNGVLFPVILAQQLGVRRLFITNAAGGINRNLSPCDLMLIVDHLNLMHEDPARSIRLPHGKHEHTPYYSPALIKLAKQSAAEINLPIRSGVYCAVKGPNYETVAETEMLSRLGADAVGMSTVPEVMLAHRLGIDVLGVSVISNMATGISRTKHSHSDVTAVAKIAARNLTALLERLITKILMN